MAQQLKDKSLSDLVYKDDLTSLHNRRYLRRYLSGALGSPKEQKVHSLLWLDVDHFKRINDTQGHKCGDQVLIHVAEALRTSFRDSDTVVRYAGDEFVVVLPDTEKRVATTLADRMRRHILDSPFVYDRNQPPLIISVSAGVASFPADAKTVDELLEQADRALYQSKRSGRGKVSAAGEVPDDVSTELDLMRRFPCPKLIGREDLLEDLMGLLPTPSGGDSLSGAKGPTTLDFVLLMGPAGVGKSRLLSEMRDRALKNRLNVHLIACSEEDTLLPYRCIIRILDDLLYRDPTTVEKITATIPDEGLFCLKRAMPHLPINKDLSKVSLTAHTQRQVMLKTMVELMDKLAEAEPFVIVFDELQNVDLGSMTLAFALRNRGVRNLAFFGAIQPALMEDAVKRLTPLGMFFSAVKSERFLREIPVRPLNREDTREMIKAILPGLPPAPKLEDLIWSAAGGNPLFVQAHLKSLIAQGQITVREGAVALDLVAEPQAPKSMEAAVSSELAALDQETSSLVTNAAIAGPVVELQLLQSLIGVNQGFAQQLLDKAQKAAILDQDEEEARVKFASEAVRQVAYQQTDEEVRRKAHGQIAQVIEEKSKDNLDAVLAELAHHYGKSGYKEKAVEFQTRLKTLARSIFDPNETGLITVKKVAPKIPELDRILSASSASRILPFVTAFLDAVAGIEASPPGQDPPPDLGRNVRLALMPILDNDDPLTVSVAAEHVIANGLPITADPKDPLPLRWRRVLLGHNARSITFRSGVQDREIELLLNAFAHRSRVHVGLLWPVWLGENDIENIYIEQEIKTAKLIREGEGPSATFSAMRGAPAPPPKPAAPAPSPPPADQEAAPPPAGSLAARLGRDSWTQGQKAVAPKTAIGLAERFLKSPATSIMSKEARDALLRAFDTAITEDDRDSIGTLVDAVKSCLTNPSADVRLQATGLLEAIFSKCEAHKCESLEDVMTGILCEVLPREMDARVYGRFGRIASEAANRTLKRGDYDTVRRLVDALMHAGDQGTATRAFRALQIGPTQQLLNSEFFDLLLDDLGSGDPDRESAANFVLNIFGDLVVSRAVRALSESESVRARLAVVSILKAHRHAALAPIQERFQASVHTAELKRILSVIGELLPEARSVISTALAHPSDEVAMEATRALSKLPAVEATVELVKLLDNPRLVARLEALRLIGDMRLTDAEEDVRQMLSSDSEEVLREVCITLGKLGSTNSVSSLCRILRRRGFLGLFGGLSPAIRAAAAWALGQIGDVQAAPALRKASRDRKLAVQAAAKLALGSLAQKKTGEK